jgi:hypothetical protein
MKKIVFFVVLMVVVLVLAGCGPSVGDAKTQFCNDWKELAAAVASAKTLDQNATVEQAKDAQDQIAKAWDKAKKSAANLKEVQLQATEEAFNTLKKTVDDIPDDATLEQAGATVQAAINTFDAAVTTINTTVCVAK